MRNLLVNINLVNYNKPKICNYFIKYILGENNGI
jgi:hypothetical protein